MNSELAKKTKEWMQLERKTLKQRREADRYYEKELMALIEKDFIVRNKALVPEPIDNLIVSVGTSYEPIVLNISLLKPNRILFLYTEKSKEYLDKVVEYCSLRASSYEKKLVNEISPIDIYKEIKEAYLSWDRPGQLYIDFTGGTKAMSAAAALAGAMINVQMIYVASDDYLVDFRKPNPGSEKLVFIENPLAVFGDLEIEKANELFVEYNFSGAREKLEILKESIPDPMIRQELRFLYLLSCAYEAWDSLNFEEASKNMDLLQKELNRDGRSFRQNLLMKNRPIIDSQSAYLRELARIPRLTKERKNREILENPEIMNALMFTMGMNASTRERQQKYDMATLLLYRLLEMIEQRCLARYNLFVSDMRYDCISASQTHCPELANKDGKNLTEWLQKEVYIIRKELFGNRVSEYLPNPVSLLDGFIILSALRDPIIYQEKNRMAVLKTMRAKVYLRNNSIFAHGLGPVQEDDYRKFSGFVRDLFIRFVEMEKIEYSEYAKAFQWIIPEVGAGRSAE